LSGFLKTCNTLRLTDFKTRNDVDSDDLVEAVDDKATPFLVVPKVSNFPGLDAVLALGSPTMRNGILTPETTTSICLQMTRGLVHAVADEGVDILNAIQTRMSLGRSAVKNCLLFLVPEYNFNGFKRQCAKSVARQVELDQITQFVGCIAVIRG